MRLHYLDSARALLMTLGVPFHAAMVYVIGSGWLVDSPVDSQALTYLAGALHTFRMHAFFFISGFFAALLVSRKGGVPWLKDRWVRLGIPLVASILVIVPIHVILLSEPDNIRGINIAHLWFLVVLLVYCSAYALLYKIINQQKFSLISRPFFSATLCGVYYLILRNLWHFPEFIAGFPIYDVFQYAPFFLLGSMMQSPVSQWERFTDIKFSHILAAVSSIVVVTSFKEYLDLPLAAYDFLFGASSLLGTVLVLGLCRKYLSRDNKYVLVLVDASFTVYLFHHPIVIFLGKYYLGVNWPPLVEFSIITAVAFLLSFSVHRYLVSKNKWLTFIFNGVKPKT